MGFHTFDVDRAAQLEEAGERYRYLSREELLAAIDPAPDDVLADLGSGTGFYTDDVAPHVGAVHAVDVQAEMHDYYREKGAPENVAFVTSDVADLPFEADALDGAFSTMTYHEFAGEDALETLARVIVPGGRLVVADWSADGDGEAGPPVAERFAPGDVTDALSATGFDVVRAAERPETFLVVAVRQ
ncbi:class I SAM-dependent methyltransferase [Halopenitus persicus]|uniref:Methyltransferase domain-containing protein n=1 Tax=Halopenitus persicus TaxID=1048396 RepID=A0A1H3FVD6_9EURY|nr:class I SAM-dependent methyltransferase [Halopenitus persicus]QHS16796.1 methyltransferase domain-containing protein [haloarchaeon 3A1-DGR]SDX94777.1 Methyltransferase domain-containing protein [Halopenitus persicus]